MASVGRGDEVAAAARDHHPDIALLDIDMPGIDGLAAAAVLAQEVPQCRSLILTTFGRPGLPATGDGIQRLRVHRQGRASPSSSPSATRSGGSAGRRACGRSGAGRGDARRRHPPADRTGTRDVLAARPPRHHRGRHQPASWSCPRGPSATTCRPPWPKSGRATAPKPSASPTNGAGCKEHRQHNRLASRTGPGR